jgi:hypothetical protein
MVLDPADFALDALGHIDFFRQRNKKAWVPVIDWILDRSG